MAEPGSEVLCPNCHAVVHVDPGWRLVLCPRCGGVVTRMTEDGAYD